MPGNAKADKQHYNVVSDRCISFDGIAKIVASALGQEPNIVHYDPSKVCSFVLGTSPAAEHLWHGHSA